VWQQTSRSVDREVIGQNRKMKRAISPEIDRVVKQSTLSLNGEGGNFIFDKWREYEIASGVRTYGMLPKDSM